MEGARWLALLKTSLGGVKKYVERDEISQRWVGELYRFDWGA